MTVSREDALGLFNKWKNESISVLACGSGGGFSVLLSGSIEEVSPHGIVVARKGGIAGTRSAQIHISLDAVYHFEYLDPREAPPDVQNTWGMLVTGTLGCHLPTSLWVFHEMG